MIMRETDKEDKAMKVLRSRLYEIKEEFLEHIKEKLNLKQKKLELEERRTGLLKVRQQKYFGWDTPFDHRLKESVNSATEKQVLILKEKYHELLVTLLSDRNITKEVLENYITAFIEPEIHKIEVQTKNRREPDIKTPEQIKQLREIFERLKSDEVADCHDRSELLGTFYKYFEYVSNPLCNSLKQVITGIEYRIINQFVTSLLVRDINKINVNPFSFLDTESDVFRYKIPDEQLNLVEHFKQTLYRFDHSSKVTIPTKNLVLIKNSSLASSFFKQEIDDMYEERLNFFLKDILKKSRNNPDIGELEYFPEPRSIVNLILLASTRLKDYDTSDSIRVLYNLTKRNYWPDLLEQTIEQYPQLEGLRNILENFNPDFDMAYLVYPELTEVSKEFTISMINRFPENQDLISVAFAILNGNQSIDLLLVKGLINENDALSLKKLFNIIGGKSPNKDLYSSYYYFSEQIAESCRDLYLLDGDRTPIIESKEWSKIQRLLRYSEKLEGIQNLDSDFLLLQSHILHFAINDISNEQFDILLSEAELIHSVANELRILHRPDKLKLFLNNPSIEIFKILNKLGFDHSLPFTQDVEMRIGEQLNKIPNIEEIMKEFIQLFISKEIKKIDTLLSGDDQIEIHKVNWESILIAYIQGQTQNFRFDALSTKSSEKINELFSDPKVRNICLNSFRDLWISYLESGKPEEIPLSLVLITEFIHDCEGAGPLNQIESLSSYMYDVRKILLDKTLSEDAKLKVFKTLLEVEQRFIKERFSNEDRTEFYNISRDFLSVDLELFTNITLLFKELTPSQLKTFLKEIYPLYRVITVLDSQNLSSLKDSIENLTHLVVSGDFSVALQKQILIDEIKLIFKDKMGILTIPDILTDEHIRSIKNISFYLANINDRDMQKEAILSLFLSLKLNDKWDDFIIGKDIDISELLIPEKVQELSYLLEQRKQLNPLTSLNLGISNDDLIEFMKILQQEEEKIKIGNIETIDIKLGNIIINLQGLVDLDLYNNPLDKQRMQLLLDWGNKKVNSTIAKMFQSFEHSDRNIQLSEEEEQIRQQVIKIAQENGIALSSQTLNQYFQNELRPFSSVINLLTFVNNENAQQEIDSLRLLLQPSKEVIEIFQRLGEDFKPTSGAMALSQDLEFLQKLIVKRQDELKPDEISLLNNYVKKIQEKVILLEEIYSKIKDKFVALRQGMISRESPLLEEKFNQISSIINSQTTQQTVTSTLTHDLNTMIENIRECLSCSKGGFNNDTNLTFGDANKFFITSRSETQTTGSIADQIIFLEPITRPDGTKKISFVLDRMYGQNTPIILENHVETILSKVRQIKKRFPNIKLSIFVTDAALSSSGTSSDMFVRTLTDKKIQAQSESVKVDVIRSALGNHYIEFGGDIRTHGERNIGGIKTWITRQSNRPDAVTRLTRPRGRRKRSCGKIRFL